MNCHHDKNILLLLLYEELPENELQTVQEHVDGCKTCQHEFARLQETLNVYQQAPLEVPPQGMLANVLGQKKAAVAQESKLHPLFEFLLGVQPRQWAIVATVPKSRSRFGATQTFEGEMASLKKRIADFSASVSTEIF